MTHRLVDIYLQIMITIWVTLIANHIFYFFYLHHLCIIARNHIFEYLSDCVEQLLDLKSRSITKADVLEYFTH